MRHGVNGGLSKRNQRINIHDCDADSQAKQKDYD